MTIVEIRLKNLRALIERWNAVKLAKMLGYRQSSYLSQMTSDNPSRPLTEKNARRFEVQLDLEPGWFDIDHSAPKPAEVTPPAPAAPVPSAADTATANLVADMIRLVGTVCANEAVSLPPMKFADVVALAYADMMEHAGQPRESHVTQLVRLLK